MKKIIALSIVLFCFICSGCGFHLRSESSIPSELKNIYFSSTRPYSTLSLQMYTLFRSMDMHLVKNQADARFSIFVTRDNFSYSRPDIVDTTLPTTISFLHSATITIKDNKFKDTVASQSFTATQTLTLNVNQIYTANSNDLIKQQLNRRISYLIYYWLISKNTKMALHDASHTKSIKYLN